MNFGEQLIPLSSFQTPIGVQHNDFKRLGVFVDPQVTVETSKLGGMGIFINTDTAIDDAIIARIPYTATLDIPLLLDIQQSLRDAYTADAAIVKQVLTHCQGINETEIITDYLFSFFIILVNNDIKESLHPLHKFIFYLELLNQTFIEPLDLNSENDDYLFEVETHKRQILFDKYENIVNSFRDNDMKILIPSFDEYYHINKVIKSRVLEIPHPVKENNQDFTVNTTLVPFLDYANHSDDNNAYFDVDKLLGDVLLKCSVPVGKQEICIKYSDFNSVQSFVSTYGFISRSNVEEIFEIKISSSVINGYINKIQETKDIHYDLIMKWLEIFPTVQFIKTPKNILINYNMNPIPFWMIFATKFKYLDWRKSLDTIRIIDKDIQLETLQDLYEFIEFQEQNCDVVQGVEKLAIEPNKVIEVNETMAKAKFNDFIKLIVNNNQIDNNLGLTGQYIDYKNKLFKILSHQQEFMNYTPINATNFYQPNTIFDHSNN